MQIKPLWNSTQLQWEWPAFWNLQTTPAGKDGVGIGRSLFHCRWECKIVQPLWKSVHRVLRQLKINLPQSPWTAHLEMHVHTLIYIYTYTKFNQHNCFLIQGVANGLPFLKSCVFLPKPNSLKSLIGPWYPGHDVNQKANEEEDPLL